jgi:alkanesulfonate monooxygenase SsuD/methylene tetrahydromethanopterin reductase-like flavin-dependent oxidoreductase (luciferase family)
VTLPDYPLADSIEMIRTADSLGYHAVYSVDETWHKDPWILFAAASIAGTPDECVETIKAIESTGVNHMILCITDPHIVKAFTGRDVSVPDVNGQLRLIADRVMPQFN